MKKIVVAAFMVVGMTAFAQEEVKAESVVMSENVTQNGNGNSEKLSTEQRNQLRLKKLTLELNLTPAQQKEFAKIITEQSEKMEKAKSIREANEKAGKKLTKDEKFAMANNILDEKIALKSRLMKILDEKQFAKWEAIQEEKQEKREKKREHHKGKKHDGKE